MKKQLVCSVCRQKTERLFVKERRQFFSCPNCGLKFVWPIPTQVELNHFYRTGYWQKQEFRGKKALGYLSYEAEKESLFDYFQKVMCQLKIAPGRALDIGCGPGYFLKIAQNSGWEVYGVDLSWEAVKKARQLLKTQLIYNKSTQKVNFKNNFFDLITVFQTIEHLPIPRDFLEEVRRILKPRGLVLINTPDTDGWQAKLMSKHWFSYRHPDHFWFFNEKSLCRLLKSSGFGKIRRLKDPARVYELKYLIKILPFYIRCRFGQELTRQVSVMLKPLGKLKISISFGSLVLLAQKQ